MVSDFIEESDGFLALSDEMHATLTKEDSSLKQAARVVFEYGKAMEGYWDNNLFMEQMGVAVKVAEGKYPPRIYKHVWIFDHFMWTHCICSGCFCHSTPQQKTRRTTTSNERHNLG